MFKRERKRQPGLTPSLGASSLGTSCNAIPAWLSVGVNAALRELQRKSKAEQYTANARRFLLNAELDNFLARNCISWDTVAGYGFKAIFNNVLTAFSHKESLFDSFCLLTWFHSFFGLLTQKIDEENEANLLAVLTETLDSIPVDEDGLPSFDALTDGDVTNEHDASPSPMPDGTPPPQEAEEPSLVRTLPTV